MGVKGLWKLIQSCGTPVPLESLENKILAIDVSIWLHQAVRGFKGFGSGTVANSHLLTLFHRICKLLFYRIRPVFVFDGGVPQLKRQTLSSRRLRREVAAGKAQKVRDRLLSNLLKSQAVRKALGKKGPGPSLHHVSKPVKKEKDLFELPPLKDPLMDKGSVKTDIDSENEEDYICKNLKNENLHNFEFESDDFQSLPLETQHEILSELQVTRKENSWNSINEMPQESNNFSSFQMDRLLRRCNFQKKLDDIRSEIRKITTSEMEAQLFGELEKHVSFTHKIISEDSAHSILVKNVKEMASKSSGTINDTIKKVESSNVKSSLKQDFLTELSKHGIVSTHPCVGIKRNYDTSFSQSSDDSFSDFSDEESYIAPKKKKLEEASFIKALDYVLDDNELTQEEILKLIQQTEKEVEIESSSGCKKSNEFDSPSTSANAPGIIYNSDAESSSTDDDDFIDVTDPEMIESSEAPVEDRNMSEINEVAIEKECGNNIDKVLGAKSDSLYLKILKQKLVENIQHSLPKTKLDTRKLAKENAISFNSSNESPTKCVVNTKSQDSNAGNLSIVSPKKNVPIFLDFRKQVNEVDDIFRDIFHKPSNLKSVHVEKKFNDGKKEPVLNTDENVGHDKINNDFSESIQNSIKLTDELRKKLNELVQEEVNKIINSKEIEPSSAKSENGNCIKTMTIPHQEDIGLTKTLNSPKSLNDNSKSPILNSIENDRMSANTVISTNTASQNENCIKTMTIPYQEDKELTTILKSTQSFNSNAKSPKLNSTGNDRVSANSIISKSATYFKENEEKLNGYISDSSENTSQILVQNQESSKSESNENFIDESITDVNEVQPSYKYSEEELKNIEHELVEEQNSLIAKANDAERVAVDISDQVYKEAQELLQIFGLPYIVAPMEAEAQCAFLDKEGLTHGTITNDSDIFLFGGKKVYKNFFDHNKYVECFKTENINYNLGLDRNKMITLALLTGSDYTIGIESVGSVLGMEILTEFPGQGIECLKNLKKWWNAASKTVTISQLSKAKQKLSQLFIPDAFPNEKIYDAYLSPEIDDSKEKFSWGVPNIETLKSFTAEKFGWNQSKTNEILLPVLKKLGLKETQMRIESYFNNIKLVKEPQFKSKRLEEAIAKSKEVNCTQFKDNSDSMKKASINTSKRTLLVDPSEGNYVVPQKRKRGPKKKSTLIKEINEIDNHENSKLTETHSETNIIEKEMKPLSKEEKKSLIFKKLQEKEKVLQSEKERAEKEQRKKLAAEILFKNKAPKK